MEVSFLMKASQYVQKHCKKESVCSLNREKKKVKDDGKMNNPNGKFFVITVLTVGCWTKINFVQNDQSLL